MRKKILIGIISLLLFVTLSQTVLAVSWLPLVPCGTSANPTPCNRCDLFKLFKNIIDFVLMGLMPPAAAILFVWGGFNILMGGANPGLYTQGKNIFWNTAIGVAIISASWLITNSIIRSIGTETVTQNGVVTNVAKEWWKFECRVTTGGVASPTPIPTGSTTPTPTGTTTPNPTGSVTPTPTRTPTPTPIGNLCSQPAQLATSNNVPYPRKNAPELNSLIACIKTELPFDNLGSEFTYDKSYEICNYTRGQRTCSSTCSHAVNSCHYGGATGTEGALAVDFGNQVVGERIIAAAIKCGAKSARCETASGRIVSCGDTSANHVHVNSKSCDKN